MKHIEVRNLHYATIGLINYLIEKKEDNFHLLYGLQRNLERLQSAVKTIEDSIAPELKEIETKAAELGKKALKEKPEEKTNPVEYGISLLTKEEQEKHTALMKKYTEFMDEENEAFIPYLLNPDKLEGIKIEYEYMLVLNKFLPEEK